MIRLFILAACFAALLSPRIGLADTPGSQQDVANRIEPLIKCVSGQRDVFTLTAGGRYIDGQKTHEISARLTRIDADSFDLDIRHQDYWLKLSRRTDQTVLILPLHKRAFVGSDPLTVADHLRPQGILDRLVSPGTMLSLYLPMIWSSDSSVLSTTLPSLLGLKWDGEINRFVAGDDVTLALLDNSSALELAIGESKLEIDHSDVVTPLDIESELDGLTVTQLARDEIEQTFARGLRRALEVLAPSPLLTKPQQREQKVAHGQLSWIQGHRVALLSGTPEQIGRAHAQLLQQEAVRCIDSVVHMFAVARTIESGRWFRHDLEAAYQRLEPFIPEDHKQETIALAESLGCDSRLVQTVNVFPELFHCSGFAVFGSATSDGKLYHGRVLDYMTTIGLQDSATTFIVSVDGKFPFATVGYAGFIGSVSGMNDHGISLGEMGGRGEGQWDGVPMATLMRRAMEECSTLAEVKSLWTNSPRTCEYYYVFADGKTNDAVGVAATPASLEFIDPGQPHPLLGDGIVDAVVLSAGDRLKTLRDRVQQRHGRIDVDVAKWLMSRPVAMESNLHNVLFVPQDGVMYVANADHRRPAAENPYVKIDLRALLESIDAPNSTLAAAETE